MQEKMIDARKIDVGYGARRILVSVDLSVHRGDFWFILGPNGEGKTTLFKALLGVISPSAGVIERVSGFERPGFVGFVPQRSSIKPTLPTTVREFIGIGTARLSIGGAERRRRITDALEKVGLSGFAERDFWSLSGGQRQRVLVARALALEPQILFVDEPTNGLDFAAEEVLLRSLARLNGLGLTILFITHELRLAARFASRVALVSSGSLAVGSPEEMLVPEKVRKVWGVDPREIGVFGAPTTRPSAEDVA